ncbi:MAG: integrin alpha, partial [Acidobacteriota bacterium]|nr:integrin alpha [Acidobacteriota bacterium]
SAGGLSPTPDWEHFGPQPEMDYGRAVASAGDINRDGYADVIVGAESWDTTRFCEDGTTTCLFDEDCVGINNEICLIDHGAAYVFLGSSSGLGSTPAWEYVSTQALAAFGISVASADVNGDGFNDVIVGAEAWNDQLIDEGRVFMFYGCLPSILPAEVPSVVWTSNTHLAWTAAENADSYDVIRSGDAEDFVTAASCVTTTSATNANDNSGQSVGQLDFYLIRPWGSSCPGPVGVDSNDEVREVVPSCN